MQCMQHRFGLKRETREAFITSSKMDYSKWFRSHDNFILTKTVFLLKCSRNALDNLSNLNAVAKSFAFYAENESGC